MLGPLQDAWDAWSGVQEQVSAKPWYHFPTVIAIQFAEAAEHKAHGQPERAANEIVDIMSVCLNWLRWMGYTTPKSVATIIRARAANRYAGQTQAILDKYQQKYGI